MRGVRLRVAGDSDRHHREVVSLAQFQAGSTERRVLTQQPLQFEPDEDRETLGLTGLESYDIEGIAGALTPGKRLTVRARSDDGGERAFTVVCRIDTPVEVDYYNHGGILPFVLRQLLK